MRFNKKNFRTAFSICCLTLAGSWAFMACSSDSDDSSDAPSAIVLSGQLALSEGTGLRLQSASVDDLSIYCVTFDIPPVAGTGDIAEDGSFSLTLNTTNSSVGCFFLLAESVVGTMVFEDPEETDLSGESSSQDRLAFSGGNTNLGAITLDLTTGQAVVDVSQIQTDTLVDTDANAAAAAVDFTGSYVITSSGLTLPDGYFGVCADNSTEECHGPSEGEPIYIKLIEGVKAGTQTPAHAMMIWESEALYNTCGTKLGFTYAQGINHGIDFTDSGVAEGVFTWKAGLEDGWKDTTNARAQWSQMKMEVVSDFNGYSGMKQYFSQYTSDSDGTTKVNTAGFQFNANTNDSGCKNAAGEPKRVDDWGSMQCTGEQLTGGLHKSTCTGTSDGETVTCIHIGGTFTTDGTAITNGWPRWPEDFDILLAGPSCSSGQEQWGQDGLSCSDNSTPTQGALCSSANTSTAAGQLAQLRCYLEYNHNSRDRDSATTECVRKVRGNWNATTADEFIVGEDGPQKAEGQHVFDLFKFDSATSGTLRGQDRYFEGVQMGDNWTDCEIQESFSMAVKKYPDSDDLLAEMIMTKVNLSHKPACISALGEEAGSQKMLFKLEKQ